MSSFKLIKVKNRNRCWAISFKDEVVKMLDVRDLSKESIIIKYDYDEDLFVLRLATVVEAKGGSNIRKPNPNSNTYLSNFTLDTDVEEGIYEKSDSYEEDEFTYFEFKLVD